MPDFSDEPDYFGVAVSAAKRFQAREVFTHALEYGTQGRGLHRTLCGTTIRLEHDAGHSATCLRCQNILQQHEALAP